MPGSTPVVLTRRRPATEPKCSPPLDQRVRQLERQLRSIRYDHRRSLALCEEAPEAYKNIESVLRVQKDLVKIARWLQPLLGDKGT